MKKNKPRSYIITFLFSSLFGFISINAITNNFGSRVDIGNTQVLFLDRNADGYITENQHFLDVLHYDIDLNLFHNQKRIEGKVIITAISKGKDIPFIDLNLYESLKINSIKVNNLSVQFVHNEFLLRIFEKLKLNDTLRVQIEYSGTPHKMGLSGFVFGQINKLPLTYTINEPEYASGWFPCNDMPSDKSLLDMKITNDKNNISVSNGRFISVSEHNDKKTYHWKTFYPISTYLISVYSSPYETWNEYYVSEKNDTLPLNYYVLPGQLENAKIDFEDHHDMLKFFGSTFGEYPFMKEKYGVAVFLWQMGAMENQTISGIGSVFITGKKYFRDMFAHELVHHWWGNAVGPKTWKDIWLNEGFATYSEALYNEWKFGKDALQTSMLAIKNDGYFIDNLSDPKDLFGKTVYNKGAWVLHMLRRETGDSIFFSILKTYFNEYKYKSASISDFVKTAEEISNKSLGVFFNQWLYNDKSDLNIKFDWAVKNNNDHYELNLKIDQLESDKIYAFRLDVRLEFEGDSENIDKEILIDKRNNYFTFKLKNIPEKVLLDPENWLLAKITYGNSYE